MKPDGLLHDVVMDWNRLCIEVFFVRRCSSRQVKEEAKISPAELCNHLPGEQEAPLPAREPEAKVRGGRDYHTAAQTCA